MEDNEETSKLLPGVERLKAEYKAANPRKRKQCNLYPELLPPPPPQPEPEPDYQQMMDRLNLLQPGETLVYYTGFLARQRGRVKKLGQLAQLALDLQRRQYVRLFQRKVADSVFDYIAVGTRRQPSFDQNEIRQEIADATL